MSEEYIVTYVGPNAVRTVTKVGSPEPVEKPAAKKKAAPKKKK